MEHLFGEGCRSNVCRACRWELGATEVPVGTVLQFTIAGPGVGKQRARFAGRGRRPFTPAKTRAFEQRVGLVAATARPAGWPQWGRYRLWIVAVGTRCDADNVLKAIADGCEAVLWGNDRRITDTRAIRRATSDAGGEPRTEVEVELLAEDDPPRSRRKR